MRKYLIYLALPIAIAALVALRMGAAMLAGPAPRVALELRGGTGAEADAFLAEALARAGYALAPEAAGGRPRLFALDRPFDAWGEGTAAGGPFHPLLDEARDAALNGAAVMIGYACLAGTERPELRAELAAWAGVGAPLWAGRYFADLGSDEAPARLKAAWEAAAGRAWEFTGPGVALEGLGERSGAVVVLRRGAELSPRFLELAGEAGGVRVQALWGASFVICGEGSGEARVAAVGAELGAFEGARAAAFPKAEVVVSAAFGLTELGRAALAAAGVPERFPILTRRPYGRGTAWVAAADVLSSGAFRPTVGPASSPSARAAMVLDEPTDPYARAAKVAVPFIKAAADAATAAAEGRRDSGGTARDYADGGDPPGAARFRAGRRYLERSLEGGAWEPWFVKAVNYGPAEPGRWFAEAPRDEASYALTIAAMSAAGFDALRVYTLLPPAFYRALAAWNLSGARPLYLIQEIWLDEDAPGHDLADPAFVAAYLEESDRVIDAIFGRASIAERRLRAWGEYGADLSPWLAAVLVGRELLPEEIEATRKARPGAPYDGALIRSSGGAAEAVLARMADRAAARLSERGSAGVPLGFVSWPTLDPLYHPSDWVAGASRPPYNDREEFDFSALAAGPGWPAGIFAAYHIYPNYPDFMTRSARYEPEPEPERERAAERAAAEPASQAGRFLSPAVVRGVADYGAAAARYRAYLDELLAALPPMPLFVAEFGLATGYGAARLHPEGWDHGGLSEADQARGLVELFKAIAEAGAAGGAVFQWADEWAKKTWTSEPFMIPYERHPLWHNVVDPEQNYGVVAWEARPTGSADAGAGLGVPEAAASEPGVLSIGYDPAFLRVRVAVPGSEGAADGLALSLGLDLVPGAGGERRLYPGGPEAPIGAEFLVRVDMAAGTLRGARLLAHADYNRGGGRLSPTPSELGGFTRMLSLVNPAVSARDGRFYPSLWEDGGELPLGPGGLAELGPDGYLELRLPWSRLNAADPSSRRWLLDPRPDPSSAGRDGLRTIELDELRAWGHWRGSAPDGAARGEPFAFVPGRAEALSFRLSGWEGLTFRPRPKAAFEALAGFLPGWEPEPVRP